MTTSRSSYCGRQFHSQIYVNVTERINPDKSIEKMEIRGWLHVTLDSLYQWDIASGVVANVKGSEYSPRVLIVEPEPAFARNWIEAAECVQMMRDSFIRDVQRVEDAIEADNKKAIANIAAD